MYPSKTCPGSRSFQPRERNAYTYSRVRRTPFWWPGISSNGAHGDRLILRKDSVRKRPLMWAPGQCVRRIRVGCDGRFGRGEPAAGEADTFPKLLIRNAEIFRDRPRHPAQGPRHLADLDLGAGARRGARLSRSASMRSASSAATSSPSSAPTSRGSIGRCAPARRSAPCRCRSMPTRSPTRWPTCSSTPRCGSRSSRTRSRSTRCCRSPIGCRSSPTSSTTSRAACATTTTRKAQGDRRDSAHGPRGARRRSGRLARWREQGRGRQRQRSLDHPLHVGHHRPAEGRDAHLRQRHHLGAQRQRLRQARPRTRR